MGRFRLVQRICDHGRCKEKFRYTISPFYLSKASVGVQRARIGNLKNVGRVRAGLAKGGKYWKVVCQSVNNH